MEFEKKKGFPENVGKRIIEALKTNEEAESENFANDNWSKPSSCSHYNEPEFRDYSCNSYNFQDTEEASGSYYAQDSSGVSSSNVDTLVDLVTKLPPGVTKQTGAQIIRHTMEAMGISMDKVLSNAQKAQENMNQEIKNNINEIEEHREKIKFLDQEIHLYRKKVQDLESIINLFILSENKK